MELWPRAWTGTQPTASVLESPASSSFPSGDLLLIDLSEREERSIAQGRFHDLRFSPRRRHVEALRVRERVLPREDEPMGYRPYERSEVVLFRADDLTASSQPSSIGPAGGDVVGGSLVWSSDETRLAFTEWRPHGGSPAVRLFRLDDGFREMSADLPRAASRSGALSFVHGDLLVRSVSGKHLRVDSDGQTSSYPLADEARRIVRVGNEFIGLFGDKLQRIVGESLQPLSPQTGPVDSIVWPRPGSSALSSLVIRVGDELRVVRLDVTEVYSLPAPGGHPRLLAYHESAASAVWAAEHPDGSFLWASSADAGAPEIVTTANEFVAEIARGAAHRFEYAAEGGKLSGWIYHPPGEGPWPTVAWVYPGLRYGAVPPTYVGPSVRLFLNANVLVSAGYAILFPSMPPLRPSDRLERLADSVLPALDAAITEGWTDPDRVGVFGHSEGGFAALGLAAVSDRFRSVAAAAAPSDPVRGSGIFQGSWRYTDEPHLQLFRYQKYEEDLGGPLYRNRDAFASRSPLAFADQVEAPVLLLHGDLDYVPIELSEQIFSSLLRQEKRARFVRLIGEGHSPESPANILEFWNQVVTWFDETL